MVASDTLVGIVGAVLLVGVMAGVFVYEYNNIDDSILTGSDDSDGSGAMAAFLAAYPTLNATEDLDGDGEANFEDGDIDGDGINNTDDDETTVIVAMSGSIGPQGGPVSNAVNFQFLSGMGATKIHGTVTLGGLQPDLAGSTIIELVAPDGTVAASSQFAPGSMPGASASVEFTPAESGDYTLRVSQAPAGMGASFDIEAGIHY